MVTKLLAVLAMILFGVIFIIRGGSVPGTFKHPLESIDSRQPSSSEVGQALYGVLWAYDGW